MGLTIIYGKSGTGKSKYLYDYIKENVLNDNFFVITPEQFSYTAEKKLIDIMPNDAVINAEVLTFNRMAYRVLNEVGGITKKSLQPSGKSMLIYQILTEQKNDLKFIGKSMENVELVSTQITEFKKHGINENSLKDIIENTQDKYLKIKLQDMETVYCEYQKNICDKFIDENDALTLLSEKLGQSHIVDNSTVMLDEFSGFTKQEYDAIKILLKKAKNVFVTICTDSVNQYPLDENDVFLSNKQTINKLTNTCNEAGVAIEEPICLNGLQRFKNNELIHLEENIYKIPYKQYEDEVKNISLFLANNPYSEIENIAKQIVKLVKGNGYRYKDIAVITKNIENYSNLCKVIFKKYNIPVFIDEKKEASQNVLIKYILSILDIFAKNWSYDSVISYIKTGFADIDIDTIYFLENYCLKWGIKGNKWYNGEWAFYDETEEEIQKIIFAREKIITPLLKFKQNFQGTKTVKQITEELYKFLIENGIPNKLEKKIEELNNIGELEIAKEYEASYNMLVQIFDEIVLILGENKITFENYADILKMGLRNSDLGKIPTTQDEVIVGDIDRSRSHKVKSVFIIGLNDGIFPSVNKNEGFFDDKDRQVLKDEGVELAKGTLEQLYDDNFNIYKAFTTAEEKIFLSYLSSDAEGKALRPSILINKIKKIFKNIKEDSDIVENKTEVLLPNTTFDDLLLNIRKFVDGEDISDIWIDVFKYYLEGNEWSEKLLKSIELLDYSNSTEKIRKENIEKLYGNTIKTSVSRLEQYSSCPFSYYLKYGLKLSERDIFKIKSIDTGTFMHEVIDDFFSSAEEIGNVKELSEKQIEEIVNNIINAKLELKKNYIFTNIPRYRILVQRLKKIIFRSMKYIIDSLKYSDFEVMGHELEFGSNKTFSPIKIDLEDGKRVEIIGKIDRVDIAKVKDDKYIRIIDYKSSVKDIDLDEVIAGVRLQLLTYLDAVCKETDAKPAGAFYYNLIEPMIKAEKNMTDEQIEDEIRKQFRMRGLLLADIEIIRIIDKTLETGESKIVPAKINKDETLSKKTNNITKEQFEFLQEHTNKMLKQISKEILDGNIEIKPYYNNKTKKSACEYCPYKPICN